MVAGIPMLGEGSPLYNYSRDYSEWVWQIERHADDYEATRNYTSDHVTLQGRFGKDHWARWGDLVNPLSIIQDGIDIAEMKNAPKEPAMPPEVKALLRALEEDANPGVHTKEGYRAPGTTGGYFPMN